MDDFRLRAFDDAILAATDLRRDREDGVSRAARLCEAVGRLGWSEFTTWARSIEEPGSSHPIASLMCVPDLELARSLDHRLECRGRLELAKFLQAITASLAPTATRPQRAEGPHSMAGRAFLALDFALPQMDARTADRWNLAMCDHGVDARLELARAALGAANDATDAREAQLVAIAGLALVAEEVCNFIGRMFTRLPIPNTAEAPGVPLARESALVELQGNLARFADRAGIDDDVRQAFRDYGAWDPTTAVNRTTDEGDVWRPRIEDLEKPLAMLVEAPTEPGPAVPKTRCAVAWINERRQLCLDDKVQRETALDRGDLATVRALIAAGGSITIDQSRDAVRLDASQQSDSPIAYESRKTTTSRFSRLRREFCDVFSTHPRRGRLDLRDGVAPKRDA